MAPRIPGNAFELYVGLGPDRSYQQVADQLGVNKRSVTKLAKRQRWAERVAKIEREAQERVDAKLTDELEEMKLRHRKLLKAITARAAKAITELPLATGMEGVRAAEAAIKLERLIAGQASERTELSVEEITRREMRSFLVKDDDTE
jgi:hypothetical protein